MAPTLIRPQIVILREGTDTSQGKPALLSNISSCLAVVDILRTTLGPRGMDKLIVNAEGHATISNDGATILKLLDVVHPAARALVDIARAQDAEVGDGTTSVVLLAGELLRQVKPLVEEGVAPQVIIRAFRQACKEAISRVQSIAVQTNKDRSVLERCAKTAMNSKLVSGHGGFFSKMVVDAVLRTHDQEAGVITVDDVDDRMIGIKKVPGGTLEDSFLVDGVSFKKTFSYAGFEQQPKAFDNPRIACLNVELELKAERDNAEVRVTAVQEYQAIVDAEWTILYDKLKAVHEVGANIVLSRLPIGDVATQWFADRNVFCAGRVANDDLQRVISATGGAIHTSLENLSESGLGTCARFEERQVGNERFNFMTGCPSSRTCTLILRGGAEQFIAEIHRSLHDAIMIVRRTLSSTEGIVAGGGAVEMDLARHLREHARTIPGRAQLVFMAFARAFETIPRQIAENAGLDGIDLLALLRKAHTSPSNLWFGLDLLNETVADNMQASVWEPALIKTNAIASATEAACMILSVDLSIELNKRQGDGDFAQMAQRAGLPGAGR